ncbi:hypothetical protein FQN60_013260 [Etheostoma spectabile]|uniref:Uncharacterized protein n=1 Tax=Etheostoma spectabile TaxID=54343 RepID=A0A5J5DB35_9PERO|nr:hypothetical protein FQN60_013260 [Etheostoma spectabile]
MTEQSRENSSELSLHSRLDRQLPHTHTQTHTSRSKPAATVMMSPVLLFMVNMLEEGLWGFWEAILYRSIPLAVFGSSLSTAVTVITKDPAGKHTGLGDGQLARDGVDDEDAGGGLVGPGARHTVPQHPVLIPGESVQGPHSDWKTCMSSGNCPREFSGTLIGGMTQSLFTRLRVPSPLTTTLRHGNKISGTR